MLKIPPLRTSKNAESLLARSAARTDRCFLKPAWYSFGAVESRYFDAGTERRVSMNDWVWDCEAMRGSGRKEALFPRDTVYGPVLVLSYSSNASCR